MTSIFCFIQGRWKSLNESVDAIPEIPKSRGNLLLFDNGLMITR
jgi:hypothetical protein